VGQHVLVELRQRRDPAVGDAAVEVRLRVSGLTALQLGVGRQRGLPRLGRVPERADRGAAVGEEEPPALQVVRDDFHDSVRPARVELGRQPGLERLHRPARLEPRSVVAGERDAVHRRPGPIVHELDLAGRLDVRTDPFLGVHDHRLVAEVANCQTPTIVV
jgi:hypothetical protein